MAAAAGPNGMDAIAMMCGGSGGATAARWAAATAVDDSAAAVRLAAAGLTVNRAVDERPDSMARVFGIMTNDLLVKLGTLVDNDAWLEKVLVKNDGTQQVTVEGERCKHLDPVDGRTLALVDGCCISMIDIVVEALFDGDGEADTALLLDLAAAPNDTFTFAWNTLAEEPTAPKVGCPTNTSSRPARSSCSCSSWRRSSCSGRRCT